MLFYKNNEIEKTIDGLSKMLDESCIDFKSMSSDERKVYFSKEIKTRNILNNDFIKNESQIMYSFLKYITNEKLLNNCIESSCIAFIIDFVICIMLYFFQILIKSGVSLPEVNITFLNNLTFYSSLLFLSLLSTIVFLKYFKFRKFEYNKLTNE